MALDPESMTSLVWIRGRLAGGILWMTLLSIGSPGEGRAQGPEPVPPAPEVVAAPDTIPSAPGAVVAPDTIPPAAVGDLGTNGGVATGHVSVYPANHRYPQDDTGMPFVLIGFGNETKNTVDVLSQFAGRINYTRCYAAGWDSRADPNEYGMGRPYPTVNGLTDMDQWNEAYWSNLRDFLTNAQQLGLNVGLTLFDGHYDLPGGKIGTYSTWNSARNVQGVQWAFNATALSQYPNPSPSGGSAERLVYYQRRWVDRLLHEIAPFSNVILELDNETSGVSSSWFLWWADHFLTSGAYVIATTGDANGSIADNVFSSDSRLHMKSYHLRDDAVITSTRYSWNKIIVADADNSCTTPDGTTSRRLAWRSMLRGGHWNDFTCGGVPLPSLAKLDYYKYLLDFIRNADVRPWEMAPHTELVTSGMAMAKPGSDYLVYTEANVTVNLTAASGTLLWQWYNPRDGTLASSGTIAGGASRSFTLPGSGDWVLWITK